jgi:hypothetical protein
MEREQVLAQIVFQSGLLKLLEVTRSAEAELPGSIEEAEVLVALERKLRRTT